MIAREWKCRVPERHRAGFTQYLYETGVADASDTEGFLGAQILCRALDESVELTLLTYWRSLDTITRFAGDDISVARLYPEDARYELDPDRVVRHYDVIEHRFDAMPGSDG